MTRRRALCVWVTGLVLGGLAFTGLVFTGLTFTGLVVAASWRAVDAASPAVIVSCFTCHEATFSLLPLDAESGIAMSL